MQRELNFDIATLDTCIGKISNRRARRLVRGLLITALTEPNLVEEIDGDGSILMTASNSTVARWAEVSEESIRVNTRQIGEIRPTIIEKSPTVNTPSEWLIMLANVMPADTVQTVVDILNSSRKLGAKLPPTFEKLPPTLPPTNAKVGGKVAPNFSNLSSICFCFNTASWLAEKLKSLGVAARSGGEDLASFHADDAALDRSETVTAIADAIARDQIERDQVFLAAAIARDKNFPWSWFRSAMTDRYELKPTKQQRTFAALLQRVSVAVDAESLMPRMTADQAWQKLKKNMALYSYEYEGTRQQLRESLGVELYAAAQSVGIGRIARSNPEFQQELKAAFTAFWNDQAIAAAIR